MLSRIAESLFWIGRYVERAKATARMTDVTYHHTLGLGATPGAELRRQRHWEALIAIAGDDGRFYRKYERAGEHTAPAWLILDPENPNSVISCVAKAREQARTMRHQIASEMWEALNRFHLELQREAVLAKEVDTRNAHDFYRSIVEFSHLFLGVTDSTMPREEGWYFLIAGRFLERAEKTARTLDVQYHLLIADAAPDVPVGSPAFYAAAPIAAGDDAGDWRPWQTVLQSLSAAEAYHKLYRSAVRSRTVVELLTLSPVFPRSICFSLGEVETALGCIGSFSHPGGSEYGNDQFVPGSRMFGREDEAERAAGRLHGQLVFGVVDDIFAAGLHPYLLDVQRRCNQIGEHIQDQYFAARVLRPEEVVA